MSTTSEGDRAPRPAAARLSASLPVLLLRAAHPRQALGTALALAAAAALAGRPWREVVLVAGTVLVGQALLGWHDDLVDRGRDARHDLPGKPVARGLLDPGTVWFTIAVAVLLVVPLATAHGPRAGAAYLLSLLVAAAGDRWLAGRPWSWLPWAAGFGLWPAFLAYGGWGGQGSDTPPTVAVTALAALLGVCVHVLRALPGLVRDHEDGLRPFPLLLALRTGTPRLLVIASVSAGLAVLALLVAGRAVGLT